MYLPAHFAETRAEPLHALMRERPFATLVHCAGGTPTADHLPLALSPDGRLLRGHVARANPLWQTAAGSEVLAVFHGPQAYVSPGWYPTKREHGKAVPTWNYVTVHAHGRLRVVDDPGRLREMLDELVDRHEEGFEPRWRIADAPADYIDSMLRAIVGVEIEIGRLEGKWKVSQNQPAANREGVVAGLRDRGGDEAGAMADLVNAAGGFRPLR